MDGAIDEWLRVASINKITTKNTWEAPLIDHFFSIGAAQFDENVDFQRVALVMDGCVKVYSTRVDDVSEDTTRLLEQLNCAEKVPSKARVRKDCASNTIESNGDALKAKNMKGSEIAEPQFLRERETAPVLSLAQIQSNGILSLDGRMGDDIIIFGSYPAVFDGILEEGRQLLPSFDVVQANLDEIIEKEEEGLANDVRDVIAKAAADCVCDVPVDCDDGTVISNRDAGTCEVRVTPFSYCSGWTGPENWKKSRTRRGRRAAPTGKRRVIDFSQVVNDDLFKEKGSVVMSADDVVKRRSKRQTLPEDFQFSRDDLYKFTIKSGRFNTMKENEGVDIGQKMNDLSICCEGSFQQVTSNQIHQGREVPIREIEYDAKVVEGSAFTKRLFMKYRRSPPIVDIKSLQDKVISTLDQGKESTLKDIYKKIPSLYGERLARAVTPHHCILSLLFLARDNGVKIESTGSDLLVTLNNS